MPVPVWLLIVVFVGMDLLIVMVVLRACVGGAFGSLASKFPPAPVTEPAVRRRFQSFRFGLVNAGLSVHVAADERFLHLRPARVLRWVGAADTSVPWEAIEVKPGRGGFRRAKVGSMDIVGPAWALDLASPAPADGGPDRL